MKTLVNVLLIAVFLVVIVTVANMPATTYSIQIHKKHTVVTDGGRVIARLTEEGYDCDAILSTEEGHNCLRIQDAGAWESFQSYILTLEN